jgi:ATP-binding cassette subfamily B multidrug efflux pump
MGSLSYLNKYLYKYRGSLLMGLLFTIFYNVFGVIQGPMIRKSIDSLSVVLSGEKNVEQANTQILIYGLVILGTTLISGVFLYFQRKTIIGVSRLIEFDLKNEIYKHYQQLPLSFYRKNNTGDLMNRISEDVNHVRNYLGPAIMYSLNMVTLFIITVSIMINVNPTLTLYTIIPLPLLVITIYSVHNRISARSEEIQKTLSNLSTFVQEAFSGIRVLKSYSRETKSYEQFHTLSNDYKNRALGLTLINSLFFPIILFLIGMSTVMIIWVGGKQVIEGTITDGNIAEFIFYLNKLSWPVASLGWITSMVRRAEVSQGRINEFLNTHTSLSSEEGLMPAIKGNLRFDNVRLQYANSKTEALKGISFEIKAGETLAIVGNTGSGKSTIAYLACRLYDPSSGTISVDGIPLKSMDLQYYRSYTGFVPQEVFLFSDTIRANIQFGKDHATEEEVRLAAKQAGLSNNIEHFPEQYDTILGERGITLSGGQKQRVSIARALIRNPQLLILDDCLSAVDTQTEDEILGHLKTVMRNKTSLIISHRLSSVKLANRVIVLENGEIKEEGTHDQLIQKGGIYFQMYQKQIADKQTNLQENL